MKRIIQTLSTVGGAAAILLAAGCGRDNVQVYQAETNESVAPLLPPVAATRMPSSMPGSVSVQDNSGLPPLKFAVPAAWKEKPPTQMRVASFDVLAEGKQADVSVIPLGGTSGSDDANVNRWRGQVGQPALAGDELLKLAEKIKIAGQPADLYDLAGASPGSGDAQRILGVILHRDDMAWFFKMAGEDNLVAAQKPAFIEFLKSVEFGEPAAPAPMDLSQLPPSHPALPEMTQPAAPAAPAGQPTWTIPAGWQAAPLAQFLVAKFAIAGAAGTQASVNVSSLTGDGGGLLANLNRWRKQLGLEPMAEADLPKLPTLAASGVQATLIEISGTDGRTGQPAQLIGAVLPLGGQTWFYKLMGDPQVVGPQKAAFTQFIQSAQYSHDH